MDLKRFALRIIDIAKTVDTNSTKLVRKVALAVDRTVVMATPVDTGRARGNWQVEISAPASGTVETLSPSGQEALAQGAAAIASFTKGQTIHITNNLPYIGRLNEGWSAQAPAGFVEEAVHVGIAQVNDARITVKGGVK